jgi:hypothetical protein
MFELKTFIEEDLQHINCTFMQTFGFGVTASISKLSRNDKFSLMIKASLMRRSKRISTGHRSRSTCLWTGHFAIKSKREYRKYMQIPLSVIYKKLNSELSSESESTNSDESQGENNEFL